jgi:lipoate-protein ligase A
MSPLPHLTVAHPEDGLSAEMALLANVAGGAERAAFLWSARAPGLVLPERFTRTPDFEATANAMAAEGWPVVPRRTGGGITPQGPGVLNLALAFRVEPGASRTIRRSYAEICDPLAEGLATLGIKAAAMPVAGSFCDGDYNLAVKAHKGEGRKIVGTAQRWRGSACLCHALVLTDIALEPAVAAVQALSDGLGHAARFDVTKHCRVADFTDASLDEVAAALWAPLARRGYVPFAL